MQFEYRNKISSINNRQIYVYGYPVLFKGGIIFKDYEDVLFLLFNKNLPSKQEKDEFVKEIKSSLKKDFSDLKNFFIKEKNNFDDINLLISGILFKNYNKNSNIEIFIKILICISWYMNIKLNKPLLDPREDLSIVENILYIGGFDYKNKKLSKHLNKMLIAWISFPNAPSVVATRISSNIRTSKILAVINGIILGSGKKHIAARIKCSEFLVDVSNKIESSNIDINDSENLEKIIKDLLQERLDKDGILYGFGHYIFKGNSLDMKDPRIVLIEDAIKDLFPNSKLKIIIDYMIRIVFSGELKKKDYNLKLIPNSDIFWSVFLLEMFNSKDKNLVDNIYMYNILTRSAGLIANFDAEETNNKNSLKIKSFKI